GSTISGGTLNASTLAGQITGTGSTINAVSIIASTLTGNIGSGTTITAAQLKGTSTLPIAQLTSSALLATPVSGGVEFDGPCYYVTASNANRSVVTAPPGAAPPCAFN